MKSLEEKKMTLEEKLGNTVITSRYGIKHDRFVIVEQLSDQPGTHYKLFMAKKIRHDGHLELEYLDLGYVDVVRRQ